MGNLISSEWRFRIALALIVPEIMEVFRRNARQSQKNSKFSTFLVSRGHNFDPNENMTKIVSTGFLMGFRLPFPSLSSPFSFRVRRRGRNDQARIQGGGG